MKNLFVVLALGAVVGAADLSRADLTLAQRVETLGQSVETTTRYRDGKTRLDMAPGGASVIVDARSGETINLMHGKKMYIKAPASLVRAAVDGTKDPQGKDAARPPLTPTGRKDTIAGFAAEEFRSGAGGAKITFWLTHDIPDYAQAMKELSAAYGTGPLAAAMRGTVDMAHLPGFPVRIVNEDPSGTTATSTLVSVNVKPLTDADFAIPADYKPLAPPLLTPPAPPPPPAPRP